MRFVLAATLLGATVGLSGCGSTPIDPYKDMKMLSPHEAGVMSNEEDPVLDAERNHNASFAHKGQRTR